LHQNIIKERLETVDKKRRKGIVETNIEIFVEKNTAY
jgi:hypothetical protein